MIKTVIRCQNNLVIVFDDKGKQIPEYQGEYYTVMGSILKDAPPNSVFAHDFTSAGELVKVTREDW